MSRLTYLLAGLLLFVGLSLGVVTGAFSAVASSSGTADWPQWRGPKRDAKSTETGLIDTWPEDGPKLAWKATGLGTGSSSISIAGGRIFTMGERGEDQVVIALSQDNGKEVWATRVGKVWGDKGYSGPRGTPTIDGKFLYAVGTDGDLVCCDVATGAVRWKKNFKEDFGGKMMSGWGFSESPLVDGEKLIVTPGATDAMLVALNKLTGKEIWRCEVPELGTAGKDGAAYASAVVSEAAGVRQYVQLVGRGVISADAKTGKFLWGYNRVANKTAVIPTALPQGDYVFASTGYGDGGAALLKPKRVSGGKFDVEEVYYHPAKELQNHHGGMVMLGDYLYFGHGHNKGIPVCVEWKTGKTVWQAEGRPAGSGSAAVVYADGHMYFRYQDATMALIEAKPDGYKLKSTFKIPQGDSPKPSWAQPVVLGGKLYLREQDNLFCYELKG